MTGEVSPLQGLALILCLVLRCSVAEPQDMVANN
jgi:hypothetical protein